MNRLIVNPWKQWQTLAPELFEQFLVFMLLNENHKTRNGQHLKPSLNRRKHVEVQA